MMVVGDALVVSGKGTLELRAAMDSSTGWFSPRLQLLLAQLGGKWLPDEATSHVAVNRIPICSV